VVFAMVLGIALAAILGMALSAILVTFRAFVTAARPFAASATVVMVAMVVFVARVFVVATAFVMVRTPLVVAMRVTGALALPSRCLSRYPQRICR
jgi:hypothetical protein